jgi:hypothetical protein
MIWGLFAGVIHRSAPMLAFAFLVAAGSQLKIFLALSSPGKQLWQESPR